MHDDQDDYTKAKQLAYGALSYRSYLSQDLMQKLIDQGVSPEVAEQVIAECRNLGYLNDDDWIHLFVKKHVTRKDGPQKIAAKLRNKGVSLKDANDAFALFCNEEKQLEQINHLMQTRYRQIDLTDFREKNRLIAALMRKGYHYSTIATFLESTEI